MTIHISETNKGGLAKLAARKSQIGADSQNKEADLALYGLFLRNRGRLALRHNSLSMCDGSLCRFLPDTTDLSKSMSITCWFPLFHSIFAKRRSLCKTAERATSSDDRCFSASSTCEEMDGVGVYLYRHSPPHAMNDM